MKRNFITTVLVIILFLLLAGAVSVNAGHFRGGVWIGPWWGPGWGPGFYGRPYYEPFPYYSEPTIIVQQPEVYLKPEPQTVPQYYWYYCQNPQGYYPYVKECPNGWMKVVPSPPQPADQKK